MEYKIVPASDTTDLVYANSIPHTNNRVEIVNKLLRDIPRLRISAQPNIQSIFPLLSQPNCKIDFVVIDSRDLNNLDGVDMFDVLKTLKTLINCTVYRKNTNTKPIRRNTKIVVMVGEATSPKLLKEILTMPEIDYLGIQPSANVTYDMIRKTVENYINCGERAPKFIVDLIKKKKQTTKSLNEIILTTRQQQIYDMVTKRGLSNKHIARMLNISESTVKLHVGAILKKYGLKNRTQLAVFSKDRKNID